MPAPGGSSRPVMIAPPQLQPGQQKLDASVVVAGFFVAVVSVMLTGLGGRVSNVAYVGISVLAGGILFARSAGGYVSFTLWLWFVTPFVRRVFDYHHGWSPASAVLIAPPAVALLSVITILRRMNELRGIMYAPYLLVLLAFGYGFSVGVINAGLIPATYALVTWLAPAFFGLHIALSWRRYPEMGKAVRTTFVWALPILAAYGLYQFVKMPRWDAAWMINADMKSIGAPRPYLARVFGTLNTPGPFAAFLATGSLMLLPYKGKLRFISIALAMVSLLLARTRAVWVAFVIGLLVQQIGQPLGRLPKRTIAVIFVALLAIPVANIPQFSAIIAPRLATLTNLSEDNSFKKRYNFSEAAAVSIVETAEGNGLGMTGGAIKLNAMQGVRSLDNGFLEVFYIYGWPGGSLFFLGIAGLMIQSVRFRETKTDSFANAVRASSVALVSILPIGDVFTGPTGTLLWMSVGFGLAGHAYHLTTGQALRSQYARQVAAKQLAAAPVALPVPAVAVPALGRTARA